jgi:hypothetical protein
LFLLAELLRLENHGEFRQRPGEAERHLVFVLLQHWRSGVLTDIEGFIEREADPDRLRNSGLRNLLLVDQQRRRGRLADPAALVFKLNAENVVTGCQRLIGCGPEFVLGLV